MRVIQSGGNIPCKTSNIVCHHCHHWYIQALIATSKPGRLIRPSHINFITRRAATFESWPLSSSSVEKRLPSSTWGVLASFAGLPESSSKRVTHCLAKSEEGRAKPPSCWTWPRPNTFESGPGSSSWTFFWRISQTWSDWRPGRWESDHQRKPVRPVEASENESTKGGLKFKSIQLICKDFGKMILPWCNVQWMTVQWFYEWCTSLIHVFFTCSETSARGKSAYVGRWALNQISFRAIWFGRSP